MREKKKKQSFSNRVKHYYLVPWKTTKEGAPWVYYLVAIPLMIVLLDFFHINPFIAIPSGIIAGLISEVRYLKEWNAKEQKDERDAKDTLH